MADRDTHDEWIDINKDNEPIDKFSLSEKARRDKEELAKNIKLHSYRVYRRAGLKPLCAVRFMILHRVFS